MHSTFELIRDLIFTPYCLSCDQIGEHLCDTCRRTVLPYLNSHSEIPTWSAVPYGGWIRDHVIAFKNGSRFESIGLARVLEEVIAVAKITQPYYLVPVPSTKSKIKSRGYDTIRLLCREMELSSSCLGIARNFIVPNRNLADQVGLNPAQRRANLAQAFSPTRAHAPGNYVVVDDITTTGATLSAMAEAIKTAGGTTICGITLCGSAKRV